MALSTPTSPLVIALTQGGNDAFVQGSVLTGLTGRQAYNVKAFWVELPPDQMSLVSLDSSIQVTVTRRSKTAIPLLSDSDVLFAKKIACAFTTSGQVDLECVSIYVPQLDVPIVEETIYAQLDSTGLGITVANVIVRMDVELDTMSDIDRLNLITRSLT